MHNPNLLSDNTLFQDTYYPLERQESIHPGGLLFSPTSLSSSFIFSQSHKISSQIWRECSCATKASRWLDIGLGQNLWPAGTGRGCPQVKTPFSPPCPLEQETKTMWTYLCWAGVQSWTEARVNILVMSSAPCGEWNDSSIPAGCGETIRLSLASLWTGPGGPTKRKTVTCCGTVPALQHLHSSAVGQGSEPVGQVWQGLLQGLWDPCSARGRCWRDF